MKSPLVERAEKIRKQVEAIDPKIVQANRQFFDEVWNFCGAVMDAENGGGQLVPDRSFM